MIMLAYYLICAFLLVLLGWNFVRDKGRRDEAVLTLVVMLPLLLRLLRWK